MTVLGLWGSSQSLPQKWHPHCLVDVVPTHNAVRTEHYVHLACHVLHNTIILQNVHIRIPRMVAALE